MDVNRFVIMHTMKHGNVVVVIKQVKNQEDIGTQDGGYTWGGIICYSGVTYNIPSFWDDNNWDEYDEWYEWNHSTTLQDYERGPWIWENVWDDICDCSWRTGGGNTINQKIKCQRQVRFF